MTAGETTEQKILQFAHDLILINGHCKGTFARTREGTRAYLHNKEAGLFCIMGGIYKGEAHVLETIRHPYLDHSIHVERIMRAWSAVFNEKIDPETWNDQPDRTVEEVLDRLHTLKKQVVHFS